MKNALALAVLSRYKWPLVSIILGLVIYFIGFLTALLGNVQDIFLRIWIFPLASIGVFWVSMMWGWGFNSLEKVEKELESVFNINESQFNEHVQQFRKTISSDKRVFLFSIPGFLFEVYAIWLVWFQRIPFSPDMQEILIGNTLIKFYPAILFAIVMYLIFASVYILFQGLFFLRKIAKSPAKIGLLQRGGRIKLDTVNRVILTATLGWFVGVSLVMTVLFILSDIIILVSLFLAISFGLLFFFVPQIVFHDSIRRSKENLLRKIESEFSLRATLPLKPDCNTMEALLLSSLFDQANRISEWAFNTSTLFKLFGSIIIPVITAFIGILM